MKVLHLASGNRWTGAAAPAFAEVEALREAGVDAHYAYVGGYKLEAKLRHHSFAHPIIQKAQNPASFIRTAGTIDRLIEHHAFDIIHTHLTWDHMLGRFLTRRFRKSRLARTFHARRVIRRDPFTGLLMRASALICVTNSALLEAAPIRDRFPVFTPPPVDLRQFTPEGADVRKKYEIGEGVPLITVIGKLSEGRGFELALETFALVRQKLSDARMMIIGHGEHRPVLERVASTLGITPHLIWAGYHEDELADHYRAADILLFTASGSDEGHRAVIEAMACGTVPVAAPIQGIEALVEKALVAEEANPSALARVVISTLEADLMETRRRMVERSEYFAYPAAAARLIGAYERIL